MTDQVLKEQAETLVTLITRLWRRMFTLTADDPAMDLPGAQMRVCAVLRDGPKSMSCLSSELGISQSAITQIADRLERAGMVQRVQETDDRRCKRLALTDRGIEVMRARVDRRVGRALEVLDSLSPADRDAALAALRMLMEASIATAPGIGDDGRIPDQLVG